MNIPAPFATVDLDFTNQLKYALLLDSVAGYATLTYGPNFPGPGNATNPTPTGLANDGTAYTATVTVDATGGNHVQSVSVVGSAAQTFANLITEINTDLGGFATAALVGDSIVITSATTGVDSTVTVVDSGANHLFASVKSVAAPFAFGLLSAASKSVKGRVEYVEWDKLHNSTQSNVSSVVDAFLLAATTNTNVPWSGGTDVLSFSPISPATAVLPETDTGLVDITASGTTKSTQLNTVYNLNVNVDGAGAVNISIVLPILETVNTPIGFSHLISSINVGLTAASLAATASFTPGPLGTLTITSNSVGTTSTVAITAGTGNDLIAYLGASNPAGFNFHPVNGPTAGYETVTMVGTGVVAGDTAISTNGTYYFKVNTDGAGVVEYNITTAAPTTFAALAAALDVAWTLGTVAFDDPNDRFVFTSGTTGTTSSVVVTAGTTGTDVFTQVNADNVAVTSFTRDASVPGVNGAAGVNGTTNVTFPVTKTTPGILSYPTPTQGGANENDKAAGVSTVFHNWNDVMQFWPCPTGFGALFTSGTRANVFKQKTPVAKGDAVRTAVYHNGSNWVYFDNGATTGGAVPPPELSEFIY